MPETPPPTPSWWQTVPGILTGLAAIITAVTGLVLAFNHQDNRGAADTPAAVSVPAGAPPASSVESRPPAAASGARAGGAEPVALPTPNRVTLAGGDTVITILSAQIEPADLERRLLKLGVRHLNAGRYPANFWSSSYRLIVDDVPRAPTNSLNEVVPGDSAKEGDVVFEVPVGVKDVVLQISAGDERSRVPLKLP